VEDIGNHLGETRLRWLGHLERMDETNLIKKSKKTKSSRTYEQRKTEK